MYILNAKVVVTLTKNHVCTLKHEIIINLKKSVFNCNHYYIIVCIRGHFTSTVPVVPILVAVVIFVALSTLITILIDYFVIGNPNL